MALSDDNADKSFFSTAVILLVCKRYRVHQNFRHTFEQPLVIFAIKKELRYDNKVQEDKTHYTCFNG